MVFLPKIKIHLLKKRCKELGRYSLTNVLSRSAEKCNGNTGCSSVLTQFLLELIYSFVITLRIVRKIKIGTEHFILQHADR